MGLMFVEYVAQRFDHGLVVRMIPIGNIRRGKKPAFKARVVKDLTVFECSKLELIVTEHRLHQISIDCSVLNFFIVRPMLVQQLFIGF